MVLRRTVSDKDPRENKRRWKDHEVDLHLHDEWLEELNSLSCFMLISICEGHLVDERPHSLLTSPHINLRLNPEYLASIFSIDPEYKEQLRKIAGDIFDPSSSSFRLEWREILRKAREGFDWDRDFTININGKIKVVDDPDFSHRIAWFIDTIQRIQSFDQQYSAIHILHNKQLETGNYQEEKELKPTMNLTLLPFGFQGNIYRSPMPYGHHDDKGQVWPEMKQNNVSVVVMLATDDEARIKAKRDLRKLYQSEGMQVIYLPVEDGDVPDRLILNQAVDQVIALAQQGHNIVVHCSAGWGRTGLFLVEIAKKALKMPGKNALDWVRKYERNAVETPGQKRFVMEES